MASLRIHDGIQLITGIAVLIGLGLVVWELQQARELAEYDMMQRDFAQSIENYRVAMGEAPMAVVAKACVGAEPLSEEDYLILDAYFDTMLLQTVSGLVLYERMGADVPGWRSIAANNFRKIFSTDQGRNWFKHVAENTKTTSNPNIRSIVSFGQDVL